MTSSLWIAHSVGRTVASGSISAIRLAQIDVSAWPGAVSFLQDFAFGIDDVWLFQPALTVGTSNNVVIVLGRSSPTEFASLFYTGRLAGDPPNTLRHLEPIKLGAATLTLPTGGHAGDAIPYADYFGAALDPVDGTAWVVGHYVPSATALGTWVGNIGFPLSLTASVNQPTFAVGQTLTASATLTDPGLPGSADLFLGVLLPDGANLVFWTGAGTTAIGSLSDVRSFRPYAEDMSLVTPFVSNMPNFISYQWTGSEPRGPYVLFHLAARAGALASGAVTAADVIALTIAPFSFP